MKRTPTFVVPALLVLLLAAAACVSGVDRESPITPEALPPTAAPALTVTLTAPTPTSTLSPTGSPPLAFTPEPTDEPAKRLALDIRAPRDGSTVRTDAVVVHGVTLPGAMVDIEGVAAEVGQDGRFQAEIPLAPGINTLQVVATDSEGGSETVLLNITSLALPPQPFLLIVTEPEDQSIVSEESIRLSGRTGPEAITSVNGVSVSVDELGFFFTVVQLEPGPNIIDVVATNDDGRVLSTVLALIYRP